MGALPPAVLGAAALAMVGAIFGVLVARAVWSDDLRHTTEMKQTWDRTKASLEKTLEHQKDIIKTMENTIAIQKRRLGEQ